MTRVRPVPRRDDEDSVDIQRGMNARQTDCMAATVTQSSLETINDDVNSFRSILHR